MLEISELQENVLKIIEKNSQTSLSLMLECNLTNHQIFNLIQPESMRPIDEKYISSVLKRLAAKGKVKIKTRSVVGHRGLKRVITIL